MGTLAEPFTLAGPYQEYACLRWRNGATPALALHGWLDNAATFSGLAPLLEGLDLVAVDLPGHGKSPHRPLGHHHAFVDWVFDVHDIAGALGWDRFVLIGHSMGAGIAALSASAMPDRITSLVMLEGLGPLPESEDRTSTRLRNALAHRNRLIKSKSKWYPAIDDLIDRRAAATPYMLRDSVRTLVERSATSGDNGFAFGDDPMLRGTSPARLTEGQVLDLLRNIAPPTLVVQAEDGLKFSAQAASLRLEAIPNHTHVVVPGKHHFHLDHPEVAARVITPFLGPIVQSTDSGHP